MQNDLSDVLVVKEELKQGDALSCSLFNMDLEIAMKRAGVQTNKTLANEKFQALGFVDDLDIASYNATAAKFTECPFVHFWSMDASIGRWEKWWTVANYVWAYSGSHHIWKDVV